MQDIGELLAHTRNERQIELEQAARETNIARRYLEALESNDYEVFPGEPYVLGFLRNYCDYLGLNPDDVIQMYKQVKIQETALPTDLLMPKNRFSIPRPVIMAFIILALAIGLAVIGYFVVSFIKSSVNNKNEEEVHTTKVISSRDPVVYKITEEKITKRVFSGDSLVVEVNNAEYTLTIGKVSPELYIETSFGTQIISLGQSHVLDLNEDVVPDVKIIVEDIDKSDEKKGALITIISGEMVVAENQIQEIESSDEDVTVSSQAQVVTAAKYKVLFDAGSAYPVTLNATFRGYCLFRYRSDRAERDERYYQKGEQLTIQANNGIRIWASNGNAVKMQIIAGGKTVDLEVSRPGEVIVKDLKWLKDGGRFKFVVMDVD